MWNLFFNKENQQRKWLVLSSIIIPTLLSIWGIRLTIQSNQNRESIETLTSMIKELKRQNDLLQSSVSIQQDQLTTYKEASQYSRRPVLTVTELSNELLGESMNMFVSIHNSGGDAYDLSSISIKGAKVDPTSFPPNRQIPSLSDIQLSVLNIKEKNSGVRLSFRDNMMNKYTQDIVWLKREGNFSLSLGSLMSVKN